MDVGFSSNTVVWFRGVTCGDMGHKSHVTSGPMDLTTCSYLDLRLTLFAITLDNNYPHLFGTSERIILTKPQSKKQKSNKTLPKAQEAPYNESTHHPQLTKTTAGRTSQRPANEKTPNSNNSRCPASTNKVRDPVPVA
ncbi:hypothetical protein JTE90_017680 [Oedothorax gibbosus]|uniref:Uncharacterized protein n=1 Tax=Oedothorax gibbosus TaxID=931172 RepID=A0AAV6UET1_9ARAC|nr:hypothetical protein JTE90_017680 [Oedothorax gibbosus]